MLYTFSLFAGVLAFPHGLKACCIKNPMKYLSYDMIWVLTRLAHPVLDAWGVNSLVTRYMWLVKRLVNILYTYNRTDILYDILSTKSAFTAGAAFRFFRVDLEETSLIRNGRMLRNINKMVSFGQICNIIDDD